MKNLFYKGAIDKNNGKALWTFLTEHYWYYTMNSWNGLKSIANNVKVYNLGLEGDYWLALELLREDDYYTLNNMIYDWESEHPNYDVGFNGRSSGYLVLTNKKTNNNVLPNWIAENSNYEEFKQTCKDYYGSVKEALPDLLEYVKLVQDFDKLCDDIREYVNELSLTTEEDLIGERVEDFLYDFNEDFEEDMKAFDIKPLELEGKKVLITDIYKSRSIQECFERRIKKFDNESPIKVKFITDNTNKYVEFERAR